LAKSKESNRSQEVFKDLTDMQDIKATCLTLVARK